MADLFTPAEANALYNRCKIQYDPTSYSLRDSLKLTSRVGDLERLHIRCAGYGAEGELVSLIHKHHGYDDGEAYITSIFHNPGDPIETGEAVSIQGPDCVLSKKDDLYVALDYLFKMGFDKADLKVHRVLEAIVQTCVALSSPKSCCADLHWLATEFRSMNYEDLHNFTRLTNALAAKEHHLPVYVSSLPNILQVTPTPSAMVSAGPAITIAGLEHKHSKAFDNNTLQTMFYYAYAYCLEVLWAIRSLPDPRLRDIAIAYALRMTPSSATHVTDVLYKVVGATLEPTAEVEALISIDNPKLRFEAYRDFLDTKGFKSIVDDFATRFIAGSPAALFPGGMGTLIGFAQTYSNTWVRVNHCRILYEYAAKNNLLEEDSFDEEELTDGLTRMSMTTGSDPISTMHTSAEKESPELMDLSVGHKSIPKGSATGAVGKYTCPTYEALDKAKAKYVDGRYTFDTKDRVDFSDTARTAYEAIANKVKLVNRLLTQRLREIKTYNTGGKQPGLTAGRVDRKAVYRYRYDPNIFYNNTYKQLESDLAFGIVLDISGSMWGTGIENGRITMIVLHETLKALGINHSIIGHTSEGRYKCTIERYQAFREDKTYHTRKNYALAKLEAQEGNCDSASLYYMEKALSRTHNRDKICVIFSDGQPTECTGTDLKEQVRHMEQNGIKVIGIGIDFPEIAEYYKDYANGKNLTDMLNIVTNILKEYILKKKEHA